MKTLPPIKILPVWDVLAIPGWEWETLNVREAGVTGDSFIVDGNERHRLSVIGRVMAENAEQAMDIAIEDYINL
jgi:hypothetical protein